MTTGILDRGRSLLHLVLQLDLDSVEQAGDLAVPPLLEDLLELAG